ncbi:reverse transcriptase domain-containing protein [Paraburkholderia sediminicola]
MQALHLLALEPVSEKSADPHSCGFRPERSTADAIEQCFIALATKRAAQWALEGDIQACFDKISHDWIIAHVPTDKVMLRKWLKAGYLEDRQWFPTEAGTPQGGIISPAIANWALDGLQRQLATVCGQPCWVGGRQISPKINFVRYADDFVVTGPSKEVLENEVKPVIECFLRERGLSLLPEKTRVTHISEGFDFLGQNVRKYNGKLLIKPSKKNVQAFLTKIRSIISENRTAKQQNLIGLLNPVIKGKRSFEDVAQRVLHEAA